MSNAANIVSEFSAIVASLEIGASYTVQVVRERNAAATSYRRAGWDIWNIEVDGVVTMADVEPGTEVRRGRRLVSAMRKAGCKVTWRDVSFGACTY